MTLLPLFCALCWWVMFSSCKHHENIYLHLTGEKNWDSRTWWNLLEGWQLACCRTGPGVHTFLVLLHRAASSSILTYLDSQVSPRLPPQHTIAPACWTVCRLCKKTLIMPDHKACKGFIPYSKRRSVQKAVSTEVYFLSYHKKTMFFSVIVAKEVQVQISEPWL